MRPVNRISPKLPSHAFKTYQIAAPRTTHFRAATCEEFGCRAMKVGWRTFVDEKLTMGAQQAYYIRKQSGRKFSEIRNELGITEFTFESGQRCFGSHSVRLSRPEVFVVKGGDWRGNPTGGIPLVHSRPEYWVEDFSEHQDKIATIKNRG